MKVLIEKELSEKEIMAIVGDGKISLNVELNEVNFVKPLGEMSLPTIATLLAENEMQKKQTPPSHIFVEERDNPIVAAVGWPD